MSTLTHVNALFYVAAVSKRANGTHEVQLLPVTRSAKTDKPGEYAPEGNVQWSKYTPSGTITLTIYSDLPAAQYFEDHLGEDVPILFG